MLIKQMPLLLLITAMATSNTKAANCNYKTYSSSPTARFNNTSSEEVVDLSTQLIWRRCPVGYDITQSQNTEYSCTKSGTAAFTWADALQAVADENAAADLNSGDSNNWRLPNIKELMSIVEHQCSEPAINVVIFPQPDDISFANQFWSSSQSNDVTLFAGPSAYSLQFNEGTPEIAKRGSDGELFNVYLVRDN